jgi:CheY-like chemotaxis protein
MHIDPGTRPPILVVDDDPALAQVMVELLELAGHRGVAVGSATAALEAARTEVPLLVVLDIKLPDLSGYEALQELRAELGERLPVLFVSGVRVEPYDRAAGLLCGGDDYLVKPFAADEFLARVRALLRRTDAHTQPEIELTEREAEVLALLATGLEPTDVAEQLDIGGRGRHSPRAHHGQTRRTQPSPDDRTRLPARSRDRDPGGFAQLSSLAMR